MNFLQLFSFLRRQKKVVRKSIAAYEHDTLLQQSRKQFEKLLKLHKIPVVLL